jgi:hypothetical protein
VQIAKKKAKSKKKSIGLLFVLVWTFGLGHIRELYLSGF